MSFLHAISKNAESDEALAAAYRQSGDMQALGALYERYLELAYGVSLQYLKDPEKARDAVMQVFEVLVVKLRAHDVERFKPWLHTVVRNHCLMQLRSEKNQRQADIDPDIMQSAEELHLNGVLEREGQLNRLEDCVDKLPQGQQQAIRMFYLEERCYQDIADETGQPWNTVRSLIQNGRRNLKICMERTAAETDEKRAH